MEIASLNIKVTQSGVSEAANGLTRIRTEGRGAAQSVDQFEKSAKRGTDAAGAMGRTITGVALRGLTSLAAGFSVLKIIQTADEMTMLEGRLKLVTRSAGEAERAFEGLAAISRETGNAFEVGFSVYQRLSFVRDEINATNDDMLAFTETVSKLGVISGASNGAMTAGLMQLGQSLSNEVVRAEEFNSIMENIPAVGKEIADQLGITTGQMRNLVIEGKLLSEDVFLAILAAQEEVNGRFEELPNTVRRAGAEFLSVGTMIIKDLNEATGATEGIADGIKFATEAMKQFAAVTLVVLNTLKALDNAGEIMANNLDIAAGEAFNRFSQARGGKISIFGKEIAIGEFDVSGQRAENEELQDATAGLKTADQIYSDFFPETYGPERPKEKEGMTEDRIKALEETRARVQGLADSLKKANEEEEKAAKLISKTIDELKFKNEQFGRSIEDQEIYNNLRAANVEIDSAAGQEIAKLTSEYSRLKSETEQVKRVTDGLGDAFGRAFEDAITGAEDFGDAMHGLFEDIQRLFVQEAITGPLKQLISGAFGGGSGTGFNLASKIGGGNTDFFGSLFGFADGGAFRVGGTGGTDSQLVAFKASPDETVSITRPDQQGGGGTNVYYNIDARGAEAGVEERIMGALRSLDRSIESRALNAVDNQFKRNPRYGRP